MKTELVMSSSKDKGIYLIQEKGCLNPYSGAFQHISMGIIQLSRYFDISPYLGNQKINLNEIQIPNSNKENVARSSSIRNNLYGTIKDFFILFTNLKSLFKLIRLYKAQDAKFVYERVSYLNFSGLLASKYLGIPHFYEANGLQFESRKKYYKSLFYSIAKWLERQAYKNSNHTFFVGSYGDYWNIKKNNWSNVENGIETQRVLEINKSRINDAIIDVCFVGRYTKHQRLEIFVKALELFKDKSLIRVNLIGTGLDAIEKEIKELGIPVVNHGFVSRDNIIRLLREFQIAVIAGSPEFQSCMKLYDYSAAGCAVIAPDIHNLKYWFKEELLFFDGSPNDLANKLKLLIEDEGLRREYESKLNIKVKSQFTWEMIFRKKADVINTIIKK